MDKNGFGIKQPKKVDMPKTPTNKQAKYFSYHV